MKVFQDTKTYNGEYFEKVYDFLEEREKHKEAMIIRPPSKLAPDEEIGNRFAAHYNGCTVHAILEKYPKEKKEFTTIDIYSKDPNKPRLILNELEEKIISVE